MVAGLQAAARKAFSAGPDHRPRPALRGALTTSRGDDARNLPRGAGLTVSRAREPDSVEVKNARHYSGDELADHHGGGRAHFARRSPHLWDSDVASAES